MIYNKQTLKAMSLLVKYQGNQVDKGGYPYIFHPYHLAEQVYTEDEIVVALLHDIIEDSECTIDILKSEGFNNNVIQAIESITKREGEQYFEYINRVKENKLATSVKIKDLRHNLLDSRNPSNNSKLHKRYTKALEILNKDKDNGGI